MRPQHHTPLCDAALQQGATQFSAATCTQSAVVRRCLLARIQNALLHRASEAEVANLKHDAPMAYLAALGYTCIKFGLKQARLSLAPSNAFKVPVNRATLNPTNSRGRDLLADVIFYEEVYAALPAAARSWANVRWKTGSASIGRHFRAYPKATAPTLTALRAAALKRFPDAHLPRVQRKSPPPVRARANVKANAAKANAARSNNLNVFFTPTSSPSSSPVRSGNNRNSSNNVFYSPASSPARSVSAPRSSSAASKPSSSRGLWGSLLGLLPRYK